MIIIIDIDYNIVLRMDSLSQLSRLKLSYLTMEQLKEKTEVKYIFGTEIAKMKEWNMSVETKTKMNESNVHAHTSTQFKWHQ